MATKRKKACIVVGCRRRIDKDKVMCETHWMMVPRGTQLRVAEAWSDDDDDEYVSATMAAIDAVEDVRSARA